MLQRALVEDRFLYTMDCAQRRGEAVVFSGRENGYCEL